MARMENIFVKFLITLAGLTFGGCKLSFSSLSANGESCQTLLDVSRLPLIGEGEIGYVFRDGPVVYKVPKSSSVAQEEFQKERNLFVVMGQRREFDPLVERLYPYLVPTEEVTVAYRGQARSALRKRFVEGTTIEKIMGQPEQFELAKPRLQALYEDLNDIAKLGYHIEDLHEGNLMFDGIEVKIVDGGFSTRKLEGEFAQNYFNETCQRLKWCAAVHSGE